MNILSIYIRYETMEETIALIKSCIISKKGGVPIGDLNGEFYYSSRSLINIFLDYCKFIYICVSLILNKID